MAWAACEGALTMAAVDLAAVSDRVLILEGPLTSFQPLLADELLQLAVLAVSVSVPPSTLAHLRTRLNLSSMSMILRIETAAHVTVAAASKQAKDSSPMAASLGIAKALAMDEVVPRSDVHRRGFPPLFGARTRDWKSVPSTLPSCHHSIVGDNGTQLKRQFQESAALS